VLDLTGLNKAMEEQKNAENRLGLLLFFIAVIKTLEHPWRGNLLEHPTKASSVHKPRGI
jgi:hypothetical protein